MSRVITAQQVPAESAVCDSSPETETETDIGRRSSVVGFYECQAILDLAGGREEALVELADKRGANLYKLIQS